MISFYDFHLSCPLIELMIDVVSLAYSRLQQNHFSSTFHLLFRLAQMVRLETDQNHLSSQEQLKHVHHPNLLVFTLWVQTFFYYFGNLYLK